MHCTINGAIAIFCQNLVKPLRGPENMQAYEIMGEILLKSMACLPLQPAILKIGGKKQRIDVFVRSDTSERRPLQEK